MQCAIPSVSAGHLYPSSGLRTACPHGLGPAHTERQEPARAVQKQYTRQISYLVLCSINVQYAYTGKPKEILIWKCIFSGHMSREPESSFQPMPDDSVTWFVVNWLGRPVCAE